MISEKDIQLIDLSILGQLSEEDRHLFDQRMQDKEFADEYNSQLSLSQMVQQKGEEILKDRFRRIDDKLDKTSPGRVVSFKNYLRWAAVATILIVAGYFWRTSQVGGNPVQLYTEYYQPFANVVDPVTKGSDGDLSGFQLYELGNYKAASEQLKSLEEGEDERFYLALCFLALNEVDKAIPLLASISDMASSKYLEQSRWYLALAQLKTGAKQEALDLFEIIAADDNSRYQERASDIVKKLK